MKYIDADRLREELQKPKTELKVGNYYLDNSEQAVGYENALVDFELLIDSLQQEPPINTELCTLIACDVIQATAKRAIEKPQDKDKEEDLMIKKMEYLNMLEKSLFQQEQLAQKEQMLKDNPVIMRVEDFQAIIDSHAKRVEADYKEKMLEEAVEIEVKEDAGGYPIVPLDAIELYDYEKDKPLAKAGDKVRVIVIKEEDEKWNRQE